VKNVTSDTFKTDGSELADVNHLLKDAGGPVDSDVYRRKIGPLRTQKWRQSKVQVGNCTSSES